MLDIVYVLPEFKIGWRLGRGQRNAILRAHCHHRSRTVGALSVHPTSTIQVNLLATMTSSTTASQEELKAHKVPLAWRDGCSAYVSYLQTYFKAHKSFEHI